MERSLKDNNLFDKCFVTYCACGSNHCALNEYTSSRKEVLASGLADTTGLFSLPQNMTKSIYPDEESTTEGTARTNGLSMYVCFFIDESDNDDCEDDKDININIDDYCC